MHSTGNFRRWYRSKTENGTIWVESKSPKEVLEMSKRYNGTLKFEKLVLIEMTDGWEPWVGEEDDDVK